MAAHPASSRLRVALAGRSARPGRCPGGSGGTSRVSSGTCPTPGWRSSGSAPDGGGTRPGTASGGRRCGCRAISCTRPAWRCRRPGGGRWSSPCTTSPSGPTRSASRPGAGPFTSGAWRWPATRPPPSSCPSEATAAELRGAGFEAGRIHVAHHGIDLESLSPLRPPGSQFPAPGSLNPFQQCHPHWPQAEEPRGRSLPGGGARSAGPGARAPVVPAVRGDGRAPQGCRGAAGRPCRPPPAGPPRPPAGGRRPARVG